MIVGKKDPATYAGDVAALANKVLELLGEKAGASASDFELASYVGPGYEKPYHEANDDIRYLARTEGIFTDPVYSGKSFPRHDGSNPQGARSQRIDGRVPAHWRRNGALF